MKSILVVILCWTLVQDTPVAYPSTTNSNTCHISKTENMNLPRNRELESSADDCPLGSTFGGCFTRRGTGACANVKIVYRSAWGAAAPKSVSNLRLPVSLVFIHHTDTPACQTLISCKSRVKNIQRDHMVSKGWDDIGYSFLVAEDGTIYEGRGWNRVGAHTKGYNERGIAFSFIGSYSGRKPPAAALTAVKKMIQCGISLKKVASGYRLYGHRDVNPTSCPGNALYHEIKTWPHYSRTKP